MEWRKMRKFAVAMKMKADIGKWARRIFPAGLWTHRFTMAWTGALATTLCFDFLWCLCTNWGGLGFTGTYVSAAVLALVLALPAVLSRRGWIQFVVLLAYDIWLICNLMYARTYFEIIPPASYLLVDNVMQFSDSIWASLRWYDISLPLIAVATVAAMGKKTKQVNIKAYLYTLAAGIGICAAVALANGGITRHIEHLKTKWDRYSAPVSIYTLPVDFVYELTRTLTPVSDSQIAAANAYLSDYRKLMPTDTVTATPARQNVVLVFVESLEGWPIGKTVEGQQITPNMNKWVADTTTWSCMMVESQVGQGRSIDGQLLVSAGLRPTEKYVYSMRHQTHTYPSLAQEMHRAMGTKSYIMSGDRANGWNQGVVAKAFGIDEQHYRGDWDLSESFTRTHHPSDKSLVRQIVERMRSGEYWPEGERALVEVVTFSSHFPFYIPEEHRTIKLNEEYPSVLAGYIEAVNYTDGALGMLVDYLKTRPDWPNTMVVIVGDHEGLATARQEIIADGKARGLVDPGQHVPLIILNAPVPGVREAEMGQVDVYTTVIDQLGINPVWPGLGFSGVSAEGRHPLVPTLEQAPDSLLKRQKTVGQTIIEADMLKDRLHY